MHPAGDADPAGIGEAFEAGGQIHPVAKDVAVLDDDVALMNADAKFDAFFLGHRGVALGHRPLHLDRIAHGIDDAGKLHQEPVAGGLDDAPAMLGDLRVAEVAPDRPQCGEGPLLVRFHQPRIAGDVGCQYRRQPALYPAAAHSGRPARRRPVTISSRTSGAIW